MSNLYLVSCFLLTISSVCYGLSCWECNSIFNQTCNNLPLGGPTEKTPQLKEFYVDCDEKSSHSTIGNYTLCRKQVQIIDGEERVVRSCGIEASNKPCYSTVNPSAKTFVCQCFEDGCNFSSTLGLSHILTVSAFILFFIFQMKTSIL